MRVVRRLGARAGGGGPTGLYHDDLEWEVTWRIVVLMFGFLVVSIVVEKGFHELHHWLSSKHHRGLALAFIKVKDELMLLGIIGLILSAVEDQLVATCVAMPQNLHLGYGVACTNLDGADPIAHLAAIGLYGGSAAANASAINASQGGRRLLGGYDDGGGVTGGSQAADVLGHAATIKRCNSLNPPQDEFMSLHSIHQIHILIFLIAMTHIIFSAFVITVSLWRVRQWTQWEHWGDDPGETVARLRVPRQYKWHSIQFMSQFLQQFTRAVDPYSYIAIRRFYVLRNNLEHDFPYKKLVEEMLNEDLGHVVGISWWMWVVVIIEFVMEGYGLGRVYFQLIISILMCLLVGTQMVRMLDHISIEVFKRFNTSGRNDHLTQCDLDNLQAPKLMRQRRIMDDIEVSWIMGYPRYMLEPLRAVLFAGAVVVSSLIFYTWQIGAHACWMQSRSHDLIVVLVLCGCAVFHMAVVTVPMYAIVITSGHHIYREQMVKLKAARDAQKLIRGWLARQGIRESKALMAMSPGEKKKKPRKRLDQRASPTQDPEDAAHAAAHLHGGGHDGGHERSNVERMITQSRHRQIEREHEKGAEIKVHKMVSRFHETHPALGSRSQLTGNETRRLTQLPDLAAKSAVVAEGDGDVEMGKDGASDAPNDLDAPLTNGAESGGAATKESKIAADGLLDEAESLLAAGQTAVKVAPDEEQKKPGLSGLRKPSAALEAPLQTQTKRMKSFAWSKVAPMDGEDGEKSTRNMLKSAKWRMIGKRLKVSHNFNFLAQVTQQEISHKSLIRDTQDAQLQLGSKPLNTAELQQHSRMDLLMRAALLMDDTELTEFYTRVKKMHRTRVSRRRQSKRYKRNHSCCHLMRLWICGGGGTVHAGTSTALHH
jgi:mlo protein